MGITFLPTQTMHMNAHTGPLIKPSRFGADQTVNKGKIHALWDNARRKILSVNPRSVQSLYAAELRVLVQRVLTSKGKQQEELGAVDQFLRDYGVDGEKFEE